MQFIVDSWFSYTFAVLHVHILDHVKYFTLMFFFQDELNVLKIGNKDEMEKFPSLITNVKDLKRKKELENALAVYEEGNW